MLAFFISPLMFDFLLCWSNQVSTFEILHVISNVNDKESLCELCSVQQIINMK